MNHGSMKVAELARQFNMSKRNFERKFKKHVGLSPKSFSNIIRIEKCRSLIKSLNFNNLTEVSYMCNFYDQAHCVREFKSFVEETPKQYLSNVKKHSSPFKNI